MSDQLQLFTDLAAKRPKIQEPIAREAYVEDGCRFWLKRAWGEGPHILWVMLNPSLADANRDDPTMKRVMEFSALWGFGSCVVVNLIPAISPKPEMAMEWLAAAGRQEQPNHMQMCDNLVEGLTQIKAAQAHVAAFGNAPYQVARDWLQEIAEADPSDPNADSAPPISWLCLGTTNSGMPKHPLARGKHRVPVDFKPVPWKLP